VIKEIARKEQKFDARYSVKFEVVQPSRNQVYRIASGWASDL